MNKFQKLDTYGQSKVINELNEIFTKYQMNYDQHIIDKGRVDLFFTASTVDNHYMYASECKDRWYNHVKFNEWMIEIDKYNELMNNVDKGYKPLYINTFEDNWLIIWDLSKIDISEIKKEQRWLDKSTVAKERGKVLKWVYLLPTELAVYNKKITTCS